MESKTKAPQPLPVTVLRGHSERVQTVCFLNDEVLLSGCQGGVVKAWNLERRRVSGEFVATSHRFGILRLDILSSDKIVSHGRDGVIRVWSAEILARGDQGGNGQGTSPPSPLLAPAPAPIREIATGASHFCQFALARWRSSTAMSAETKYHSSENLRREDRGKEIDEDGGGWGIDAGDTPGATRRRIHHGGDGDVGVDESPERSSGVPMHREGHSVKDKHVSFCTGSFAENVLLAPCESHAVRLWDLRIRTPADTIAPADPKRKGILMCARLMGQSPSCSAPYAICGHDGGHLCFYDLRASSKTALMESRLHEKSLLCVDIGSSCTKGVSGSADDNIHVFGINLQKGLCNVVKTFRSQHPGTACVEIRRDQKLFVSGGWDHRARVFSWRNPRPLAILRSHDGSVTSIAHSQRIGGFASGSTDSRVAIWNVFPGHGG